MITPAVPVVAIELMQDLITLARADAGNHAKASLRNRNYRFVAADDAFVGGLRERRMS